MRVKAHGGNETRETVKLLEFLAEASDPKTEIEVLRIANSFLSKQSRSVCRFLCDSGATTLVLKCLHRCKQSGNDDVIVLMCGLLGNLLFNSSDKASQFFHDHGGELVSLLFVLIGKQKKTTSQNTLIGFFHRLGGIKVSLLSTRNGHILVTLLQKLIHVNDGRGLIASMLLCAWTRNRGNRMFVARLPNAVRSVVDCAVATIHLCTRYYLAGVLRNLAMEKTDQIKLVKTKGFLKSLDSLLVTGHGLTKAVALSTVEMLASDNQIKLLICHYNRASIVKTLAATLALPDYQIESARTIFRLVERKTVSTLIKRCPDLIANLSCLSTKSPSEKETAKIAAYSLIRIAKYLSVSHKSHPTIMEVFLRLSTSCEATIRIWSALALLEQCKSQINAFVMVRSPLAMKALVTLLNDSEMSARNIAVRTMLRIASDISNMKVLIFHSEAVESVVNHAIVELQQGRLAYEAIELILVFTGLQSAHGRLAKQYGLVESLALYGVADDKLRHRTLRAVSVLAAHL